MKYQRDAAQARHYVDELIGLARAGEVNKEAQTALEDCRMDLVFCINSLEEEIGSLLREINNLTDSRWEDPHP